MEFDFVDSEEELALLVFDTICELPWYARWTFCAMLALFPKYTMKELEKAVDERLRKKDENKIQ